MSVSFPLTQGIWGRIQSGLPTVQEAKSYGCLETNARRGFVVVTALVAAVATPIFFILDLFYLALKAMGCCTEKADGTTITLPEKDITDKTSDGSSSVDVFNSALKPEDKPIDHTPDKKPDLDKGDKKAVDKEDKKPDLDKGDKKADAVSKKKPIKNDPNIKGPQIVNPSDPLTPIQDLVAAHTRQIAGGSKVFDVMPKHRAGDGFLGLKHLKQKMKEQVTSFREWAQKGDWHMFSHRNSHYDWWAFPVCRESQKGFQYSVSLEDIEQLKQDPEFMNNFRTAVKLVVLSWGWDLENNCAVRPLAPGQNWDFWDVRLGKMATSLRLFGEWDLLARVQAYVKTDLRRHLPERWVLNQLLLGDWNHKYVDGGLD